MSRIRCLVILAALSVLGLTSCKSSGEPYIDWRWPLHVHEQREAWKEATGRDWQSADGANPYF